MQLPSLLLLTLVQQRPPHTVKGVIVSLLGSLRRVLHLKTPLYVNPSNVRRAKPTVTRTFATRAWLVYVWPEKNP